MCGKRTTRRRRRKTHHQRRQRRWQLGRRESDPSRTITVFDSAQALGSNCRTLLWALLVAGRHWPASHRQILSPAQAPCATFRPHIESIDFERKRETNNLKYFYTSCCLQLNSIEKKQSAQTTHKTGKSCCARSKSVMILSAPFALFSIRRRPIGRLDLTATDHH